MTDILQLVIFITLFI